MKYTADSENMSAIYYNEIQHMVKRMNPYIKEHEAIAVVVINLLLVAQH